MVLDRSPQVNSTELIRNGMWLNWKHDSYQYAADVINTMLRVCGHDSRYLWHTELGLGTKPNLLPAGQVNLVHVGSHGTILALDPSGNKRDIAYHYNMGSRWRITKRGRNPAEDVLRIETGFHSIVFLGTPEEADRLSEGLLRRLGQNK